MRRLEHLTRLFATLCSLHQRDKETTTRDSSSSKQVYAGFLDMQSHVTLHAVCAVRVMTRGNETVMRKVQQQQELIHGESELSIMLLIRHKHTPAVPALQAAIRIIDGDTSIPSGEGIRNKREHFYTQRRACEQRPTSQHSCYNTRTQYVRSLRQH